MKFESQYKTFHSWKCIWKHRPRNGSHLSRMIWVNTCLVIRVRIHHIQSQLYNAVCELSRLDTCYLKDRAHLSTFRFFIFEKFSCFIVLVVFLVIVQSSELISVWFCEKMTFNIFFISYHIFAIYVGGASLGVPTACRLIAVSGARLPSADGLAVRCIKNAPPC